MTLGDIAVLARVKRPVVTVWRGRPHVEAGPFPEPAARIDGQDRFARTQIVEWLRRSGRGNNPEVGADAALHARPPVPTPAGGALAEALLAVAASSGEQIAGLDRDDLLDLAEEIDPDDRFATRELTSAGQSDVLATAGYVDALLGAARGPQEALAHLRRDPSWFSRTPDSTAPAPAVVRLVGALAQALADPLRTAGRVPVADPTGCGADLVLGVLAARSSESHEGVLARPVAAGEDEPRIAATRESWRTLTIHGAPPEAIDTDAEAHIDIPGTAVIVARYPHPGASTLTPDELLEAVEDVLVQLRPDQRAVVLGPATVLTDSFGSRPAERMRRGILDTGRLRALVRLGRGSAVAAPQRRLALWVFGPAPPGNFKNDGRTAVADLAGLDLDEVRDDLVSDVLAAVEDRPLPQAGAADETQGRAHVFQVARYQRTFAVLARDGDLVPRDLHATPRRPGPHRQAGLAALVQSVAAPLPGVQLRTRAETGPRFGHSVTVRELLDAGRVRLVAGTRLGEEEIRTPDATGGLLVVGVPELGGQVPLGRRVVDHLAFTAAHPRAARTEAGDVIFCAGSTSGAWVDLRGGTVVHAPARALRVVSDDSRPDRVIPQVLATDLARGSGPDWRAFAARLVPAAVAQPLTGLLDEIAQAAHAARQRADALTRLSELLADESIDGRLTAMMDSTELEGH